MSEHPTAAELEGLVRGDLTREQAKMVVRHLLRGCESCLALIAPYASGLLDRFGHSGPAGFVGPAPVGGAAGQGVGVAKAAGLEAGQRAGSAKASVSKAGQEAGNEAGNEAGHGVVTSFAGRVRAERSSSAAASLPEVVAAAAELSSASHASHASHASNTGLEAPDRTLLESAYDRAIDRAFAVVLRHGEQAARNGAKVRETLAKLATGGLDDMQEPPAELRGLAGFEALLERSWAMRREDPRQMVKLAELAGSVAAELGEEGFSAGQVDEFRARAAIELANAYRVMDRLDEARSTIDEARRFYRSGSQERLLGARLLEVDANIRGDGGELEEALPALERVLKTYRRYGDPHLAGRCLIKMGIYTARAGRRQEAVERFTEGIETIDPRQDAPLVLAAVHNTACCLVEDGRYREARSLLWRHLAFYEQNAGRVDRLKLRWLQGQIHAGLGQYARAERAFQEVREDWREAGKTHYEAAATVDLAGVHQRQGRDEEARGLAITAAELLLGLGLSSEALTALGELKARLEQAATFTPELAAQVTYLLRQTAPDDQPILLVRSA